MATGKQPTPQEAAGELFGMLRRGGKDAAEAALYMDSILGRWMDRYFQRMGVSEAEAEEMTMDVWVKVLKGQYEDRGNGYALLCRIRKSRFVEYLRYRSASKRSTLDGGVGAQRAEITGDDDLWDLLNESAAADEPPSDLLDCVKRKMFVYEQVSPGRAALLEMIADGLSYKEIAAVLFDKAESDVDAKEVARVRNRIEEARKQAAQYFEECKESS